MIGSELQQPETLTSSLIIASASGVKRLVG